MSPLQAASATSASQDSGRTVLDPARGAVIARVRDATPKDVDGVANAAKNAFDDGRWSLLTPWQRGDALLSVARRLREHHEELSRLESLNVGKTIVEARGDIGQAAEFFEFAGRTAIGLSGDVIQNQADQITFVLREPVGVVAAIVPWNFPLAMAAGAIAGPLAVGNTVVLKPSSLTPLSALRMVELIDDLLPSGVLQVVPGPASTGAALASHDVVDRIVFTGSTETGKEIMRIAAAGVKRIGLELGGKSPTIVLADADFEKSVPSALARITMNQGENCAAGSRLLVEHTIYDDFVAALVEHARGQVLGDPQDEETDLGPMISAEHRDRVIRYLDLARAEGKGLFVGETPQVAPLSMGFFVPLSIWEAGPGARVWREEVFGPLLVVTSFRNDAEAVALANDSPFGLLATIWCGDRGRGLRIARELRCGIIHINNGMSPINGPWGGYKASGLGRAYGRYAMEESTELKQINLDIT